MGGPNGIPFVYLFAGILGTTSLICIVTPFMRTSLGHGLTRATFSVTNTNNNDNGGLLFLIGILLAFSLVGPIIGYVGNLGTGWFAAISCFSVILVGLSGFFAAWKFRNNEYDAMLKQDGRTGKDIVQFPFHINEDIKKELLMDKDLVGTLECEARNNKVSAAQIIAQQAKALHHWEENPEYKACEECG